MTEQNQAPIASGLTGLIPNPGALAQAVLDADTEDELTILGLVSQALDCTDHSALDELYTQAYEIGADAASALVSEVQKSDTNLGVPPALKGLLASSGRLWLALGAASAKRLAKTLVERIRGGEADVQTLEKDILLVLEAKAFSIAQTEVTRAMTTAAISVYRDAQVQTYSFMTAGDTVVCATCSENENAGSLALGEAFPNGLPPCHPNCRCTVVPDYVPGKLDSLTYFTTDDTEPEDG